MERHERLELSVVVAPTGTGAALGGALEVLSAQEAAPRFEVIVPYDAGIGGIGALGDAHPGVRFIEVEGTAALTASCDIGVRHEAIDRRRAAGLAAGQGEVIALTEEYARPAPDWCARLVALHARLPHAVIGGAIEPARDQLVNWALYFGDAGRYQSPLPEGPAQFVSDVNVSYKREALYAAADEWRERYHETGLHDALRRAGHTLWLDPALIVRQDRGEVALGDALRERFAWARLYAGRRAAEVSPRTRWLLAVGAPLLGPVLFARQARVSWQRGRHRRALLRTAPLLALMDVIWSAGEMTGYIAPQELRIGQPTTPMRSFVLALAIALPAVACDQRDPDLPPNAVSHALDTAVLQLADSIFCGGDSDGLRFDSSVTLQSGEPRDFLICA